MLSLPLLSVIVGFAVLAYTDPPPLARAQIVLRHEQRPKSGAFVTHSNGTWYLYDQVRRRIHAYPDRIVRAATVHKRPNGEGNEESLGAGFLRTLMRFGSP